MDWCEKPASLILPIAFLLLGLLGMIQAARSGRMTWSNVRKGDPNWRLTSWHLDRRKTPIRFHLQLAIVIVIWVVGMVILTAKAAERCGIN